MAPKRIIAELGQGATLHSGDYTKAAIRAVHDAIHHSSMSFIRALGLDSKDMQVDVTIGVQNPDKVDTDAVKAAMPRGQVTVKVVHGGLDIPDTDSGDLTVVASAAVEVRMDLPQG